MAGNKKKLSSGLIAALAVLGLLLIIFFVNQFGGGPGEVADNRPAESQTEEQDEVTEPKQPEDSVSVDSTAEPEIEEEEPLNWYSVIDGQWRYSFEEDIEMRINFYNRSFFRTQALPPETSVSRGGSWRFLGEDEDSVAVRLLINGSEETEVLHLVYIDDKTLQGRYNSSPPGVTTLFTKVLHQ